MYGTEEWKGNRSVSLLNPLTVLAGQENGAGKGTHTHTHLQMENMCVCKNGTCWGSEGRTVLCYVINSTFGTICDCATEFSPSTVSMQSSDMYYASLFTF